MFRLVYVYNSYPKGNLRFEVAVERTRNMKISRVTEIGFRYRLKLGKNCAETIILMDFTRRFSLNFQVKKNGQSLK